MPGARTMTGEGMLEAVRPWQEREPGLWARISLWVASRGKPSIGSTGRGPAVRPIREGCATPRTFDSAIQLRAIDPLDSDFLAFLEKRDQRLYAIMGKATGYRAILNQVKPNWVGHDPEVARAVLSRWQDTIQEIQRLAAEL